MTGAQALPLISAIAASLWLGIILLLHFIKPELDPRMHMVSEYACAPRGAIMQAAFYCMAVSCWALGAATWPLLSHLGPALLVICGVGFVGAGVFITDPVAQGAHTRNGALHLLFSLIVIPLFPIMATVVAVGLSSVDWLPIRPWLTSLAALTWAGFIGLIGAGAVSGRRRGTPVGLFQRFMILTYSVWLIATSIALAS